MSGTGTELEVKFYLSNHQVLEETLLAAGARLVAPRVHEINLRYDTPARALTRSGRLLRLRMDSEARITYKGPGLEQDGARLRQELEFTVSDFEMARATIEALGYQVMLMYEKYRTTYQLENVLLTLDEMPYGLFAEIEGPDGASIQAAAGRLGLDWQARILDSYTMLFDAVRASLNLTCRDLSFANFQDLKVTPENLGVQQANR
ncbi:MAG: class IV adenylate cyclase [Anaerolineales bacterium]|nr:class IV adenylate cyclase [Anaerolineales bacterium]